MGSQNTKFMALMSRMGYAAFFYLLFRYFPSIRANKSVPPICPPLSISSNPWRAGLGLWARLRVMPGQRVDMQPGIAPLQRELESHWLVHIDVHRLQDVAKDVVFRVLIMVDHSNQVRQCRAGSRRPQTQINFKSQKSNFKTGFSGTRLQHLQSHVIGHLISAIVVFAIAKVDGDVTLT